MSDSTAPQERTFRAFTSADGKLYATGRVAYPPALFDLVLQHHTSTGGSFSLLLDVGCGPGNCTRVLSPSFENAIGADASPGMIATARELGGKTKSEASIRFEVSSAEAFSEIGGLEKGSVDLITVAAAAHWFNMPKFWAEAAKVLKPGGTVAIWVRVLSTCHPSTPNVEKIQAILDHFMNVTLVPWEELGNKLTRNYYDDLPLPWSVSPPIPGFSEAEFVRHEYDRDGVLSNGRDFFFGGAPITIKQMERGLATSSAVKRWAEANKELVGTEQDIVKVLARDLKEAMGDLESVVTGTGVVILLLKKSL